MKELSEFQPTTGSRMSTRTWMRRLSALPHTVSKRGIALALAGLMIPIGFAQVSAFAQDAPPPPPDQQGQQGQYDQGPPPPDDNAAPPQQWNALSPDQMNELVAPIALYPDSLVAQVLAAATYPTQVVEADRFVQSQGGAPPDQIAQMVNSQPWDPSVKALCAFPSVLANMDKNLDWTTQLGNAYYNQPQDVMSAFQGWYAPPPPLGWGVGVRFGFGVGVVVGGWGHYGWGYGHWGFAWGPHPYVAFNHATYISRSFTVVNHGYYGRFDRAPEARRYNVQAAHSAYAAGERNGFNRGERNGYNNGFRSGANRGTTNNNYRAPSNNNYSRPNNNTARPAVNQGRPAGNNNYNRPNTPNNNRPQNNNYNRPNTNNSRPNNQSRPAPHNESKPSGGDHSHGGGGDKGDKGDKGGHPHGR